MGAINGKQGDKMSVLQALGSRFSDAHSIWKSCINTPSRSDDGVLVMASGCAMLCVSVVALRVSDAGSAKHVLEVVDKSASVVIAGFHAGRFGHCLEGFALVTTGFFGNIDADVDEQVARSVAVDRG